MQILFRLLLLIVFSGLGFILVPLMVNLLIYFNLIDSDAVPADFLQIILSKSTYVWMGAVAVGIIGLFIEQKWRIALMLCPLIIPSLFAFLYPLI